MIKLSRPVLWLAIVFAAGIMLVPQRGAAGTIPCRYYEPPPPLLGEPDDPPDGAVLVRVTMLPAYWLVNTIVKYVIDPNGRTISSSPGRDRGSRSR